MKSAISTRWSRARRVRSIFGITNPGCVRHTATNLCPDLIHVERRHTTTFSFLHPDPDFFAQRLVSALLLQKS